MNLKDIVWTSEIVEEWLQIAALVDKSLPSVIPKPITGQKWEIRREWYELLWDVIDDKDKPEPKFQPTNAQMSMWEEVNLRWYQLVDSTKNKKILWMRSTGAGWVKIAKVVGMSRQSVAARYQKALQELAKELIVFYHKIS